MSRVKHGDSSLSGLVDSDSDDALILSGIFTPDSGIENMAPAKKGRGRPKAATSKVTKVARAKSSLVPKKMNAAGKRAALADKTNQQNESETEEIDDAERNEDLPPAGDESRVEEVDFPTAKTRNARKEAVKNTKGLEERATAKTRSRAAESRQRSKATRKMLAIVEVPEEKSPEKVVPETQMVAMDVDTSREGEDAEEVVAEKLSNSRQKRTLPQQPWPVKRIRGDSASDTERSDPNLRRKLGEMTKKYDMLNNRYQDLREIGLKEAERNFERLKKQTEEKNKISNELIAALEADLATQTEFANESSALKKRVDCQSADIVKFQAQISQLTTLLSESQIANKALSAKLAANRSIAASIESAGAKVPGSAVKAGGIIRMMGTAEAAQAAQAAQLKEDLYSDLTGLIVRNVKRDTEEDVFDCIQTGRNGTLHFKLGVANDKSAESYDEAQCVYVPQLDPSRDKPLIEMLPDYLVDEITFPRPQAAKFYARVVKALIEKVA